MARHVVDALESEDLNPHLIEDLGSNLHFGLNADDRLPALKALQGRLSAGGWHIEWRRGGRTPVRRLDTKSTRSIRAEEWRVFRVYRLGRYGLAGYTEAPTISFWENTGHRFERLGYRGLNRFPNDSRSQGQNIDGYTYPGLDAFPVERSLVRFRDPIDVVYTWVDGADTAWIREFTSWRERESQLERNEVAIHPSRYASHDELRYSLRSLWMYGGWIRHIYLVTADQRPPWLVEDDRISIVSHKEIFPPGVLPTFNSHAIEARLHHIDGLSEHFIYMNDDVFLGRPLSPEAFFTPNGLIRYHNSDAFVLPGAPTEDDLAVDAAAKNGRKLLEEKYGRVPIYKLHHGPFSLRRSVMAELEETFAGRYEDTVSQRFRSSSDLSIASGFTQHYAHCTQRAVPSDARAVYQNLENPKLPMTLRRLLLGRDVDFFCLNSTETGDTNDDIERLLQEFLDDYFPVPSPWEIRDSAGR